MQLVRLRMFALALGLGAALLAGPDPAVARPAPVTPAWEFPLLPHVHGLAFFPESPNDLESTWAELSAVYVGPCWSLASLEVVDSAHVRLLLVPGTACEDSLGTWARRFELGALAAGTHTLTVHADVVLSATDTTREEITVPFDVVHAEPPPPVPPDSTGPVVGSIAIQPWVPTADDDITVRVYGWFPFECGRIESATVGGSLALSMRIAPDPPCTDTARVWMQDFALGRLPAGRHVLTLDVTIERPESTSVEHHEVGFDVTDPNEPPPPPPVQLIAGLWFEPPNPTVDDAVTVKAVGNFPFDCGQIVEAFVADSVNLVMRIAPEPPCADTARMWRQSFALGRLTAGMHVKWLTVSVMGGDSSASERLAISIRVLDPFAPGDSVPPIDSLNAVMSVSHPNPFGDMSRFSVSIETPLNADVAVFDVGGRRVATVFHGLLPAGTSQLAWNGRRSDGRRAAEGIYFYRLSVPGRQVTRRVILLGTP